MSANSKPKRTVPPRLRDLSELAIGIGIVLLVLFIGSFFRVRVDLTSEQRYTLTKATREVVKELEDIMYVKVYLTGELPADLRRLEKATKDLLDEMHVEQPDKLQYSFIDPNASEDEKTRHQIYDQLQTQGLEYSSIPGKFKEVIVFPGALITYRDKTVPVQLLRSRYQALSAEMVNLSVNNLEYALVSAMRQAMSKERPRIAFLEGHGEAPPMAVMDIATVLKEQYDVSRVRIDGYIDALSTKNEKVRYRINKYHALVIAKPDSVFSDRDRYVIDQFVMNGGKVLWCIDAMDPHLDTLAKNQFSIATPLELGIEELLFTYGVRINKDIILDQSCGPIELDGQPYGDQPRRQRYPFYFEPVLLPQTGHPIVANIDPVHTRFTSSMDTISVDSVRKTILLTSSPHSFAQRNPVRISFNVVRMDQGWDKRSTPYMPVAVLLEGKFVSAYRDRLPTTITMDKDVAYREQSERTAQLVISDGDAIINRVDPSRGMYFPLGYDRYANDEIYGNRDLILNAMNYLLDDRSLISIRSRAITLRTLDTDRIDKDRRGLQVFNLGLPLLITLVAGTAYQLYRRRSNRSTQRA